MPQGPLLEPRPKGKIKPIVMIFDSKPRHARQKNAKKPPKNYSAASKKTFAFVNTSHPVEADEESRRLVKTHVMQEVLRQKLLDRSKLEKEPTKRLCYPRDPPLFRVISPEAPLSYLFTYPIQTEPYMLKLVHDFKFEFDRIDAAAMLPTESKVRDTAWYPLVMTDAALFHALLCMSALFGLRDMIVQRKHMLESIRLINDRLPGEEATSDATITAVLFMAKAEYFQGNHDAWGIHMEGTKRIIDLRGGIQKLPFLIQEKIYNTDLLGCIEAGATPHFSPINPLSPPYPHNLPPSILSLAETYDPHPTLLSLLSEITPHATSPPPTHDIPNLQYRLFSLHSTRQYQHEKRSDVIEDILTTSTTLYLFLPHRHSLPPFRPLSYTYLLTRLSFLTNQLLTQRTPPQHAPFLLWVCLLGEIFSSPVGTLFREQVRDVSRMLGVTSWEGVEVVMGGMWGFEGYEVRGLWEDAMGSDVPGSIR